MGSRKTLPLLLVAILVCVVLGNAVAHGLSHECCILVDKSIVEEKIVEAYKILYKLSRMGVDVGDLVDRLDEAQKLLDKGDVVGAEKIIDGVLEDASRLEEEAGMIVFVNNVCKALTVSAIASIPVFTYFFFPRIYLELWYRLKKKWVVVKK